MQYSRGDRYLTPLTVPMATARIGSRTTIRYHRSLQEYVNGLAQQGFLMDHLLEIPNVAPRCGGRRVKREHLAEQEFPVFLGLRAHRMRQ